MKALMLIADGFEDLEFFCPYYRLLESNVEVDVAAPKAGQVQGKHGYPFEANKSFSEVKAQDYDFAVLSGGMGPEKVRMSDDALRIVKQIWDADKVVAAICHGIQILISAGIVNGKTATCWPALKDDLNAAGGRFIDQEVVVDGKLITSRQPRDIPAFCREICIAMGIEKLSASYQDVSV